MLQTWTLSTYQKDSFAYTLPFDASEKIKLDAFSTPRVGKSVKFMWQKRQSLERPSWLGFWWHELGPSDFWGINKAAPGISFWPWCASIQGSSRADCCCSFFFFFSFYPPSRSSRARVARARRRRRPRAPRARAAVNQSNPAKRQKFVSRSIFVRFGRSLHQNALEFGAEFKKAIPKCL